MLYQLLSLAGLFAAVSGFRMNLQTGQSDNQNMPTEAQLQFRRDKLGHVFGGGGLMQNAGEIKINEGGQQQSRYAVSTWAAALSVWDDSIKLTHDSGAFIAKDASDSFADTMYQWYYVNGKTFEFDVDLSNIGCSCNAALYLVSMPGHRSDGSADPSTCNDYYCDANNVCGVWCWEMDIQEANRYVTQVTPHSCDQDPGTYISNCDRGGCATNSHNVNGNGMCPNGGCIINTAQKFHYAVTFNSGNLHVKLSQNGQNFEFDACNNAGYINNEARAFDFGMVIALSYWGDDWNEMSWLDGNTGCTGACDTSGSVTFSNITIA